MANILTFDNIYRQIKYTIFIDIGEGFFDYTKQVKTISFFEELSQITYGVRKTTLSINFYDLEPNILIFSKNVKVKFVVSISENKVDYYDHVLFEGQTAFKKSVTKGAFKLIFEDVIYEILNLKSSENRIDNKELQNIFFDIAGDVINRNLVSDQDLMSTNWKLINGATRTDLTTSVRIQDSSTTAFSYIYFNFGRIISNKEYKLSIYLKAGTSTQATVRILNNLNPSQVIKEETFNLNNSLVEYTFVFATSNINTLRVGIFPGTPAGINQGNLEVGFVGISPNNPTGFSFLQPYSYFVKYEWNEDKTFEKMLDDLSIPFQTIFYYEDFVLKSQHLYDVVYNNTYIPGSDLSKQKIFLEGYKDSKTVNDSYFNTTNITKYDIISATGTAVPDGFFDVSLTGNYIDNVLTGKEMDVNQTIFIDDIELGEVQPLTINTLTVICRTTDDNTGTILNTAAILSKSIVPNGFLIKLKNVGTQRIFVKQIIINGKYIKKVKSNISENTDDLKVAYDGEVINYVIDNPIIQSDNAVDKLETLLHFTNKNYYEIETRWSVKNRVGTVIDFIDPEGNTKKGIIIEIMSDIDKSSGLNALLKIKEI